jgi:hypothetical protein
LEQAEKLYFFIGGHKPVAILGYIRSAFAELPDRINVCIAFHISHIRPSSTIQLHPIIFDDRICQNVVRYFFGGGSGGVFGRCVIERDLEIFSLPNIRDGGDAGRFDRMLYGRALWI